MPSARRGTTEPAADRQPHAAAADGAGATAPAVDKPETTETVLTGIGATETVATEVGPPLARLKRRRDFLRVAAKGRKAARDGLVLQGAATPTDAAGPARVGFTVSRKVGNAVARNRARRRLRAVAELILRRHATPGHDYVLIGRKATLDRGFDALCRDCEQALQRLRQGDSRSRSGAPSRSGRRRVRPGRRATAEPVPAQSGGGDDKGGGHGAD